VKFEGTYTLPVPREVAWRELMNPQTLARALPGCEKFEANPAGGFDVVLKIGIASLKGAYQGHVEIQDPNPPQSYRMKVEGKGTGGFLKGEGVLALTESAGNTTINYSGDAQVGGPIAGIGQRLVQAAARQIIQQFFQSLTNAIQASG
jgi:carbon monoxide dehydrogenase subunit G